MPDVGKYPGPVKDASLGPCQSPSRLPKLALCVAHSTAAGLIDLWVCGHTGSQTCKFRILRAGALPHRLVSFRLHSSPEYLLRDWSFLTARPRAFF